MPGGPACAMRNGPQKRTLGRRRRRGRRPRRPPLRTPGSERRKKRLAPELAEVSIPEVRRLLEIALRLPAASEELRWAWSTWRRAKRQQARRSHYRRALATPAVAEAQARSP